MKTMGGGLSVSQGDDRWTTIFTILLHPISPVHTAWGTGRDIPRGRGL